MNFHEIAIEQPSIFEAFEAIPDSEGFTAKDIDFQYDEDGREEDPEAEDGDEDYTEYDDMYEADFDYDAE